MRPILVARAESGKYFRSFFGRITDKLFDYETLFPTDRDIDIPALLRLCDSLQLK